MKLKLSTLALALVPALACTAVSAEEAQAYSNNSLLVIYKAGISQAQQTAANNGATSKHYNNILGGRLAKLTLKTDDIHLLMKRLLKHPAIESVELDYTLTLNEPTTVADDPHFGNLWGMKNTGQTINIWGRLATGTAGSDINAESAWDKTTGSKDVVVGVIDTGFDYTHPDLVDNIWTNLAELNGEPGFDDDGNGYVDDIHGWDAYSNDGDPMDET